MTSAGDTTVPDLLAAGVVAAVPEPRPELLERVLAGLRELPAGPARERSAGPRDGHGPGAAGALAPLPRRRA